MNIILSEVNRSQLFKFRNCFVKHAALARAMSSLHRLKNNQLLGGEQQCMLLVGDTGTGKSKLINEFASAFPGYIDGNVFVKPVLVSRIPSKPDVEKMMIQLMSDLGQFGAETRKERKREAGLAEALVKVLKKCKTQIIIINEFQELIEFKSVEDRQRVANRLKLISEQAGIPIVLVGMPWASEISNEPQWASRLMCSIELPYFKIFSKSDRIEFVRFLKGLAMRMGFEEPPQLHSDEILFPLFSATRGEVRKIKHILDEVLFLALSRGESTVNKQLFVEVLDDVFFDKDNPFKLPIDEVPLSEVSKYASYNRYPAVESETFIGAQFSRKISTKELFSKN
ncbi:TniB family NTP-binding protein [Vreelandella rituensis]|uniref:Transposase n=1 Tax=Vreelandella rituensis TaxID=2282306 RepID=A0A368TVJ1_9GAMM|nr:TniB family NTP-binding protein [Halomonas rituensis]RCV88287.1 transposase [Halomonas rituensis]